MREESWFSLTYYAPPELFDFDLSFEFMELGLAIDTWLLAQPQFQPGDIESYDLWVCFRELASGEGVWPFVMENVMAPTDLPVAASRTERTESLLPLVADHLLDLARRHDVVLPPDLAPGLRMAATALPRVPRDLHTPGRADMERTIRKAKGQQR